MGCNRTTSSYFIGVLTVKVSEILNEVAVDNRNGLGAVPHNAEIDYFGLRVEMLPTVFLKLAARLSRPESVEYVKQHIEQGGAIGAPFLDIAIPPQWFDGDMNKVAAVVGHEGRNRMMAVLEAEGDVPAEVHLLFPGEIRRRHLTADIIAELNNQLIPETLNTAISGPFFKVI